MKHPLLKNPALLIWYFLFWVVFSTLQFFFQYRVFELSLSITLVDIIVSNLVFMMLGIGIWYVVIGASNNKKGQLYMVLYHVFAMLFIVSFWMWASNQIDFILFDKASIKDYMQRVMPLKAGIGVVLYVLIAIFYNTFLFYEQLEEKSKEEARLRELVTQTQLNELKSQINPHFLFNSLNSVSYLTMVEPEKAQDMVIKLSLFLRYSLKHKQNQLVTLSQEIEHIRLYLEIEKVRFGDKLVAEFDIEECANCQIPNMILQPLYENAIKYGVYETTSTVKIITKAEKQKNNLIFTVSNNYDPDAVVKKGEGIGLFNIRQRLGLVYGNTTLLTVTNDNEIFTVKLEIPQNS